MAMRPKDYDIYLEDGDIVVDLVHEHQLYLDRGDAAEFMSDMHKAFIALLEEGCAGNMEKLAKGDASFQVMNDIIKAYTSLRKVAVDGSST